MDHSKEIIVTDVDAVAELIELGTELPPYAHELLKLCKETEGQSVRLERPFVGLILI